MSVPNVVLFPDPARRRNVLGEFLLARRKAMKLSREALIARILLTRGVRIAAGTIQKIERGDRLPMFGTLELIADGLDFGPDERAYVLTLIDERPCPPV